jgi:hypothetical protein
MTTVSAYPKSPHRNNPSTTFMVSGGRFFLQKAQALADITVKIEKKK